jgi:hypothetical protein
VASRISLPCGSGALFSDPPPEVAGGSLSSPPSDFLPEAFFCLAFSFSDDLSFDDSPSDSNLVSLDGVDAAGNIQLDATGKGSFIVRGRGASLTTGVSRSLPIRISVSASQTASNGFSLISSAYAGGEEETAAYLQVAERTWWTYTYDSVTSFFGADPETGAGIAANIAGGILIVGDVGSLVKNLWRTTAWAEKDPNVVEVVFSGLGLATEFAVGVREAADAPVSTVRALVAYLGDTPFTRILVMRLKNKILNGIEYLGESALLKVLKNGDELVAKFGNQVLKTGSSEKFVGKNITYRPRKG